ncbi:MAG: TolC family protein [Verrucomicrobiota bacterium]
MKFGKLILFALMTVAVAAKAETSTNNARSLTLEEAIRLALQHNLEVQIERVNPEIASFNLKSIYGAYDPTLGVRAEKSFNSSPGGFSSVGLDIPGNETDRESIQPFLSGMLPTGLKYDINADLLSRSSGTRSFARTTITTNGLGAPIGTNTTIQTVDRGVEYSPSAGIDLAQPLLKNFWIDSTRQQILINKNTLKISELGVRNRIMDVVTRVEQAYYDLIFQLENVRVQEKGLELADRLQAENKRRVEVGALAPLDEKQAESQAAGSRADLLTARQSLQAQENVLKNLITDDYREWHDVTIQPVEKLVAIPEKLNLMESWQRGMTQRPDLLQTRLDIERRNILLRYQRNQLFPQLDLIGSYGRNGLDRHWGGALEDIRDETNPRFSYGILFSIPLGNRGPKNLYRATKAEKEQALLQLKQLEQNVMVQIDDAVKLAQTSFERVDATRQARLYAEAALDAEQKKLENGKSTSFIVLQLQRDLTGARSEEIRSLADYNKALAQLAFAEGSVFERNHLTVEIK